MENSLLFRIKWGITTFKCDNTNTAKSMLLKIVFAIVVQTLDFCLDFWYNRVESIGRWSL
jgi:hypothetical protein